MRSKRSKKWHINRETRDARKLIEQGEPKPVVVPLDPGRPVAPHRSGSGVVVDEYYKLHIPSP